MYGYIYIGWQHDFEMNMGRKFIVVYGFSIQNCKRCECERMVTTTVSFILMHSHNQAMKKEERTNESTVRRMWRMQQIHYEKMIDQRAWEEGGHSQSECPSGKTTWCVSNHQIWQLCSYVLWLKLGHWKLGAWEVAWTWWKY